MQLSTFFVVIKSLPTKQMALAVSSVGMSYMENNGCIGVITGFERGTTGRCTFQLISSHKGVGDCFLSQSGLGGTYGGNLVILLGLTF